MAFNDYRSLLVSDTEAWHDGSGVLTYSFIGTEMPRYYRKLDTDGDGTKDAWNIGGETVPFTNDVSMTVEQRAMTSAAINAWNEVANVNLQPGTIARGGTDSTFGTPVTGDGTLVAADGSALPVNDDGSSLVDMSAVFENGLNFFGVEYDASQIYVNTNGNITFGSGLSEYTPSGISAGSTPMIAAFWADVDTRAGQPIYVDVDAEADVVTITWEDVGFYNQHAEPSNSFQMQLYDRGEGDFDVVFRYEDINWSAGTASGGDEETGLGGTPARAGYSAGNGADFFELPQSGNESAITNLENTTGNTGVEGLWVFEVRNGAIVGDITFAATEFDDPDLFGFVANFPNPDHLGDRPSKAGDLWINSANEDQFIPGTGPAYGHTSWNTYLHELGHALGLHHPNENPNNPRTSNQYTVMSYAAHPEERGDGAQKQAFPLTPMLWDIEAMQELYGANTTTRSGDTVYFGNGGGARGAQEYQYASNADNARGMQVQGEDGRYRDVILTIWDAGGQDLIDASGLTTNSRINLRPGSYSSIGEIDNNIAMASAVRQDGAVINFIEDAWGGSGHDRLRGNGADNSLLGQGGRDRLLGGGGNDQLDGGTGRDLLVGGKGADVFVFSGGSDRIRDFTPGEDRINLTHATGITDFQDLSDNHMRARNGHVVIEDDTGDILILRHQEIGVLSAEDFLF